MLELFMNKSSSSVEHSSTVLWLLIEQFPNYFNLSTLYIMKFSSDRILHSLGQLSQCIHDYPKILLICFLWNKAILSHHSFSHYTYNINIKCEPIEWIINTGMIWCSCWCYTYSLKMEKLDIIGAIFSEYGFSFQHIYIMCKLYHFRQQSLCFRPLSEWRYMYWWEQQLYLHMWTWLDWQELFNKYVHLKGFF